MSNVAKLKKKAAELEQKKQFDKALQLYVQALEEGQGREEEADVALYNRVGDLMLRQGDVAGAVGYYERAVDLYAEGGFFNNAIALCNKILRNSPGRTSIYYKLGKISAKKGFRSDAKQNFLEYADRMQKAGQLDEAFRALKEFADLCPDQDDIRLMLAEQLSKLDRRGEALEQLQTLYDKFDAEGRSAEARATAERMQAIDPALKPTQSGKARPEKSTELIFLDVSFDDEPQQRGRGAPGGGRAPGRPGTSPEPPPRHPEPPPRAAAPSAPPEFDLPVQERDAAPAPELASDGLPHNPFDASLGGDVVLGFEHTAFGAGDPTAGGALLDFQSTTFGNDGGGFGGFPSAGGDVGHMVPQHDLALPGELPMLSLPGEGPEVGGPLDLIMPDDGDVAPIAGGGAGLAGDGLGIDLLADFEPPIARADPGVAGFDVGAPGRSNGAAPPADLALGETPAALMDLPLLEDPPARPPARPVTPVVAPPVPSAPSRPGAPLAQGVDALRARARSAPGDWSLRRQLAEALLEAGEREAGLEELEMAMIGYERSGDLEAARSVAEEIIQVNPNSVRHHQKRVEYAFRTNDKARLVEAYLELADSLFRAAQPEKARAVYQRVLELAPDDIRAQAALTAFVEPALAAPPAEREREKERPKERAKEKPKEKAKEPSGTFRRYTGGESKAPASPLPPLPKPQPVVPTERDGDFVNLGDWLRDSRGPKSTRMVVEEQTPTGDEEADFAEMLQRFKQGVAENVEDEDYQSHYDLGVAYKEMGLVDEAIAEFQKALRGPANRVRTYEALGQCFLEKSQFQVAATILLRALSEPGYSDEQLVGVLYLMGYAAEALRRYGDALTYYQRVFVVDIQFRDVAERIAGLEKVARK